MTLKEQVEEIVKKLRALSAEVGNLPNPQKGPTYDETEANLDGASDSIHDAIEELQEILERN